MHAVCMTKHYVSLKSSLEEIGCTALFCTNMEELFKTLKDAMPDIKKNMLFFMSLKHAKEFYSICIERGRFDIKPAQLVIVTSNIEGC